jgi:hypothetical protein
LTLLTVSILSAVNTVNTVNPVNPVKKATALRRIGCLHKLGDCPRASSKITRSNSDAIWDILCKFLSRHEGISGFKDREDAHHRKSYQQGQRDLRFAMGFNPMDPFRRYIVVLKASFNGYSWRARSQKRLEGSIRGKELQPSRICLIVFLMLFSLIVKNATAGVIVYGDKDILGTGTYTVDPTTNAVLSGLLPGVSSLGYYGISGLTHGFPFSPSTSDFPGTDQIFVGSNHTANRDGYASYAIRGPLIAYLDFSSIVPVGQTVTTLTLGIGFDDFQQPFFHQPFVLKINGLLDNALTNLANSFDQTGPRVSFATIGIDPTILGENNQFVLTIDQTGDGGDGWAVDFFTIGVTSSGNIVPEPSSFAIFLTSAGVLLRWRKYRQKSLSV